MRLCIYAFSKLKTPGLRETADYYQRILRPWARVEEIELKPIKVSEKSDTLRTQIQEKEGFLLLEKVKKEPSFSKSLLLLLDEKGKTKNTRQWAQDIENWESSGISTLIFCIGSSLGFSQQIKDESYQQNRRLSGNAGLLSLGPQTLSHELARVVLYEQLYRAFSVIRGHPYHNEGS